MQNKTRTGQILSLWYQCAQHVFDTLRLGALNESSKKICSWLDNIVRVDVRCFRQSSSHFESSNKLESDCYIEVLHAQQKHAYTVLEAESDFLSCTDISA